MQQLPETNKSLGQHWLTDLDVLSDIAAAAEISQQDVVLEIGPGPGTLTQILVKQADQVIAVEYDQKLARDLPKRVKADNLSVVCQDILSFDLTGLPPSYKVVANIPYYLTSNLIRILSETANPPSTVVLLIQKEVAERVAAEPGNLSILGVTAQYYWDVSLDNIVPASLFTPPPKVDSQVLVMQYRNPPLFGDINLKLYFRIVKSGFGQKRKTLLNSVSNGLHLSRDDTAALCLEASIDPQRRAQTLSLDEWFALYTAFMKVDEANA